MSKSTLIWFWAIWLIDVLMVLFAYRGFINGIFGRYAAPSIKYVAFWVIICVVALLILGLSIYFKNHGRHMLGLIIAAIPILLALPYALFVGVIVLFGGQNAWR